MAFQMVPDQGTMKGAPGNEVTLFYRDPLKAIQTLLDRSSLAEHMEFAPYRLYRQKAVENDGSGAPQRTRSDDGQDKGPDDGSDDGSEERSENGSGDGPDSKSDDRSQEHSEIIPEGGSDYAPVEGSISEIETDSGGDSGGKLDEGLEEEVEEYENPGYERRFTEMSTAAWWWETQVIQI
jgi:hypothetical protein